MQLPLSKAQLQNSVDPPLLSVLQVEDGEKGGRHAFPAAMLVKRAPIPVLVPCSWLPIILYLLLRESDVRSMEAEPHQT